MKLKFFQLARKLATNSDHYQHKLDVCIVDRNKVISTGYNKDKTHPKSNHCYSSTHAEFDAILNAKFKDLRGCDLYIYRETKGGTLANSFPCIYCQILLKQMGIKNIYYTKDGSYCQGVL